MLKKFIIPLMVSLSIPAAVMAQGSTADEARKLIDDALPGDLVNDPLSFQWTTYGDGLRVKSIDVATIPGGVGVNAKLKGAKPNKWDAGINVPLTSKISKGDTVRVYIWVRSDDETDVGTRLQQDFAPYDGFGEWTLQPKSEWSLNNYEAIATHDLEPGKATFSLQLGAKGQSIEVGQIYITTQPQ